MPNSRLKIMEDEFLTSFDYYDELQVNLLFDRSIYRPMCTQLKLSSLHRFDRKMYYNALSYLILAVR